MKLFDVYPIFDVTIDHGKGCYIYDDNGQEYLDFYGGHAVISIGHCHPKYLQTMQELRKVTQENGVVLILDEIQSGYGRSGKFFAHQHYGIQPDIITVAKGIANGYPFAGVLISPMFKPVYGQFGTTSVAPWLAPSSMSFAKRISWRTRPRWESTL